MSRITVNATFLLLGACALSCNAFLLHQAPSTGVSAALYMEENSFLENAQLLLLLVCFLTFAAHYARSDQRTARLILLAAVLACFTFIVRESDLRPLGVPAAISWFSDGDGRYVVLAPPWIGLLWLARGHGEWLRVHLRRLLFSGAGAALACSALLLATGILLDKGFIRLPPSRYYEELCELNGYFFLLLAALSSGSRLQNRVPDAA